jgi:phosphoesterase RecJ-like protein
LQAEPEIGLSYIAVAAGAMERFDITSEELDGIVEHPRSITGTRMAMFFRDLGHGKVKVSFRSTGSVDVQQFARRYGGGGHAKASGALLTGNLAEVQEQVVADARAYLTGADTAAA